MRKRLKRSIQVVGAFAGCGLIYFMVAAAMSPPDPVYQGRRLSEHVVARPQGAPLFVPALLDYRLGFGILTEAKQPLEALGPKAIPLLDAWLDMPNSKLRDRIGQFAMRRGYEWERFYADRQKLAFSAL